MALIARWPSPDTNDHLPGSSHTRSAELGLGQLPAQESEQLPLRAAWGARTVCVRTLGTAAISLSLSGASDPS